MSVYNNTLTPATNKQLPDHSILDINGKQTYLGNNFILPISTSLTNTSETNVLLLENPAATLGFPGVPSQKALFVYVRRFTSDSQQVTIKNYFNPTVSTTSTAATPINLRPASTNTATALAYENSNFTLSANGTLFNSLGCPSNDYVVLDNPLLFILDPGQSLLITATAQVTTTVLRTVVSWYEL